MSKNKWYSQALQSTWDAFKSKKLTEEEFYNEARKNLLISFNSPRLVQRRDLELEALWFWYEDSKQNVQHIYFKDSKLRDFFQEIEIKDFEEAKKFLYENGTKEEIRYLQADSTTISKIAVVYRFIIHIPHEKQGYAFQFTLFEDNNFEFFYEAKNTFSKKKESPIGIIYENQYNKLLKTTSKENDFHIKNIRLAINTLAYLRCKSAVISTERPIQENLYTNNFVTLGISKDLASLTSTDKTTELVHKHNRRGYFKFYRSDIFVNRKGTTDFIPPGKVSEHIRTFTKSKELEEYYANEDFKFIRELQNESNLFSAKTSVYEPKPVKIQEYETERKIRYKRDKQTSLNALARANFCCEFNPEHETFIRKNSDKNYTEAHHLVPLEYQENFQYSLDVEANIVSLCSNCHNKIHYGKDTKELIQKLYETRKNELEKCGIKISLEELLEMYN